MTSDSFPLIMSHIWPITSKQTTCLQKWTFSFDIHDEELYVTFKVRPYLSKFLFIFYIFSQLISLLLHIKLLPTDNWSVSLWWVTYIYGWSKFTAELGDFRANYGQICQIFSDCFCCWNVISLNITHEFTKHFKKRSFIWSEGEHWIKKCVNWHDYEFVQIKLK